MQIFERVFLSHFEINRKTENNGKKSKKENEKRIN